MARGDGFVAGLDAAGRRAWLELARRTACTEWTDVVFENDWYNYSTTWAACQYRKVGDRVELRGLARNQTNHVTDLALFTLPEGFRSQRREMFSQIATNCGGVVAEHIARIDVWSDGQAKLSETVLDPTDPGNSWLNLFGMSWSVLP